MAKVINKKQRADERLVAAAETYRKRNVLYGNAYHNHGEVMRALFPDGISLITAHDQARYGVLTMVVGKLVRYCANFSAGGHSDSIHDLGVYAFMLEELDDH